MRELHLHRRKHSMVPNAQAHVASGVKGHAAKPSVIARLHNLFPASHRTLSRTPTSSSSPPTLPLLTLADKPEEPRSLKVRLMTWNMHDSLPKGNLEELLGHVDAYSGPESSAGATSFPQLSSEGNHPYHLVVFAGQECPTQSGVPMGLAGFKIIDKDKEKDSHENHDKPHRSRRNVSEDIYNDPRDPHSSGWTAMMEDWFCHGGCSTTTSSNTDSSDSSAQSPKKSFQVLREKKGPYQMLIKERMMGIYLAVFVHRDVRHLVKGASKSAVTAGLIGGRLGNKGGVGISINFDGTTLLFLNAHLAAHEGRIHNRLANLAKIKAELTVDHFLSPDDPRMMSEDLTDKFDYTFLCGDLNFRLDISRLHADWLIARQEYAQALAFDQLQNIMRNGQAFVGFNEAPIQFPPTFKYDVLRTLRKSKRRAAKQKAQRSLSEVGEQEKESESASDEDEDEGDEPEGEAASVSSSAWTSFRNPEGGGDDYFQLSSSRHDRDDSRASLAAAVKAKAKWLQIVSGSPSSPLSSIARSLHHAQGSKDMGRSPPDTAETKQDGTERISMESTKLSTKPRQSADLMKRVGSTKSANDPPTDSEEDKEDSDQGVYDSSSKKRVPSWCDRILWKSTVKPDPEPEKELTDGHTRTRNRNSLSQIFFNAFHPSRSHRDSISSALSSETPINNARSESPDPIPPTATDASALPFSRFATPPTSVNAENNSSKLRASKSYDAIQPRRSNSSSSSSLAHRTPNRRIHTTLPSITTDVTALRPSAGNPSPVPQGTNPHSPQITPTTNESTNPLGFPWRIFTFMSKPEKETTVQTVRPDDSDTILVPVRPLHKKGDVVCLDYNTLDDRGMRRLEGRSDHRPVIGSYAIYL